MITIHDLGSVPAHLGKIVGLVSHMGCLYAITEYGHLFRIETTVF